MERTEPKFKPGDYAKVIPVKHFSQSHLGHKVKIQSYRGQSNTGHVYHAETISGLVSFYEQELVPSPNGR